MSLTGSCFSSESAPRPFHHGIRGRGGAIYAAAFTVEYVLPKGQAIRYGVTVGMLAEARTRSHIADRIGGAHAYICDRNSFAALNDAMIQPKAQGSCNDFVSSFLNSNCLTMHKKVRLRHNRVATSVIGRPDAIPSKAKTRAHSSTVTEGEGLQANDDVSTNSH